MKTWEIRDATGTLRTVTLDEFKAEIAARAKAATPIMAAWKRGDVNGVKTAQSTMRKRFA